MSVILGIDLGTSSVKGMLLDTEKGVRGVAAVNYAVSIPKSGYAEQEPRMWRESVFNMLRALKERHFADFERIESVGLSGQMHGLVAIGKGGEPLRPAILWLDGRSAKQAAAVRAALDRQSVGELLRNKVFPGFAFCSLLWLKENEPEVFGKIFSVMSPKDYVRRVLTGDIGSDYSDASATGAFNPVKKRWCYELTNRFGLRREIFPECGHSADIAGRVTDMAAKLTGLRAGTPVVFGGGDQPVCGIGSGLIREGALMLNIGTGGQIACFSKTDLYDKNLRTHTFCHALPDSYAIFGATLCAGMSLSWICRKLMRRNGYKTPVRKAEQIPAGSCGLVYLPYLSGERTPHMDARAKGMFFGITLGMDGGHFVRAVMEGVTYSLKDAMTVLNELGITADRIISTGGGAASPLWLQMQADILGVDVYTCKTKEQACLGACILAAVGTGVYKNAEEACAKHVALGEKVFRPNPERQTVYRKGYAVYRELYSRTRDLMHV